MKRIKYLLILFLAITLIISCERDLETENVSKVTEYAAFTVSGNDLIVVANGAVYTDPGAVAKEGSKNLTVEVKNDVNVNQMGVYTIKYTATNSDGFKAFAQRTVVVLPAGSMPTDDLSGSYQRTAGKQGISKWTKITNGLYKVTDIGGAVLPNDYVYAFNPEPNKIIVPAQPLGGSGSSVTIFNADGGDTIEFTPGPVGTLSYKWIIDNSGYGTAVRSFIKVE
jgi:hypothetical protein